MPPTRLTRSRQGLRPADGRLARVSAVACLVGVVGLALAAGAFGTSSAVRAANGTFVVGQTAPINNLLPFPFQQPNATWDRALFDSLIYWSNGQPAPELANRWKVSGGGTTYDFNIRPGVKFSDGHGLDSNSVVQMLKWASVPSHLVTGAGLLATATITRTGPYSLRLVFPSPAPQLLSLLAVIPIVDLASPDIHAPAGTGPFLVKSFSPLSGLDLVRNPKYWSKKWFPKISEYSIKVFPDNTSLVAALHAGQIDAVAYPAFSQVPQLKKAGMTVVTSPQPPGNFMLRVNVTTGPLANVYVRQAFSMAFDRALFVKLESGGLSTATCSAYPPGSSVYTKAADAGCKFDLAAAKALLAKGGYPNGFSLTLNASSERQPELTAFAPIYKQDLAKIGVDLTIQDNTTNLWLTNSIQRNYGVSADWYPWAVFDPALLFVSLTWWPQPNIQGFESATYGALVPAAQAETNSAKRLALYRQLNTYLEQQEFVIPVATRPYVFALSPKVHGFSIDPFGMASLSSVVVGG